jgi:hypothetical protein
MTPKQVQSLRDLALNHFPPGIKSRESAIRVAGSRAADIGLQSAVTFDNPTWTAIESQAAELLRLVFVHPAMLADGLVVIDGSNDEDLRNEHDALVRNAGDALPEIEAALTVAAMDLCQLTGESVPAWLDAKPQDSPTSQSLSSRTRQDQLSHELRGLVESMAASGEVVNAATVMELLRARAGRKDSCIRELTGTGVRWLRSDGTVSDIDHNALQQRIKRILDLSR